VSETSSIIRRDLHRSVAARFADPRSRSAEDRASSDAAEPAPCWACHADAQGPSEIAGATGVEPTIVTPQIEIRL
jgi:hypothetical protein